MNLEELIAQTEVELEAAQKRQQKAKAEIKLIIDTARQEGRANLTEEESVRSDELFGHVDTAKADEAGIKDKMARLSQLQAEEREADKRSRETKTTGAAPPQRRAEVSITREERTYHPGNDPRGTQFLRDVASTAYTNDVRVNERLSRHMQEERVERGQYMERAGGVTGTSVYSGLVVPQYLLDMVAPAVANLRPFADICNKHPLPADGMSLQIPRVTSPTAAGPQTTENTAVASNDAASQPLTVNVLTAAGQQTLSRQAVERGSGIDDIIFQDLMSRYHTSLDSQLFTTATYGLAAASTSTAPAAAVTDVPGLYPLIAQGASRVESALLAFGKPSHVVMHHRRWYWLAAQLGNTWPYINDPGTPAQSIGEQANNQYNVNPRANLPFGLSVVVDDNVPVSGSADDIYVVPQRECHLWEDSNAPVMIRAEQPAAASLGVLMVVYGYFGFTFQRYAGGTQRIASGTNLTIPAGY